MLQINVRLPLNLPDEALPADEQSAIKLKQAKYIIEKQIKHFNTIVPPFLYVAQSVSPPEPSADRFRPSLSLSSHLCPLQTRWRMVDATISSSIQRDCRL